MAGAAAGLAAVPGAGRWPAAGQGALVKPLLGAEAAWPLGGARAGFFLLRQ